MPIVSKRHLIRKRSKERSEAKIVEGSALFKDSISEIMKLRAEVVRCYKVIRELQSSIAIYQATLDKRKTSDLEQEYRDQKEIAASTRTLEARPEEPAYPSRAE